MKTRKRQQTSTILKVRLFAKTRPKKEEGVLELWKHKGKIISSLDRRKQFDRLVEIPNQIKLLLREARIRWP